MIKIVDYEPWHLERIQLKACHDGERPEQIRSNAVTFLLGDEPIAIFGWFFISASTVHVWALLSDSVAKRKKSFHKAVRELIAYSFEKHGLQRMQMSVRTTNRQGWDWARALGFQCEGVMRRYGPSGADCWLFARVKP